MDPASGEAASPAGDRGSALLVQTVISCPHSKVSSGYLADVHSRDVVPANLPENTGLATSSNIGNPRMVRGGISAKNTRRLQLLCYCLQLLCYLRVVTSRLRRPNDFDDNFCSEFPCQFA